MIKSIADTKFYPLTLLIIFGGGLFFVFTFFVPLSNGQVQVEESKELPPYCLGSWEDAGPASRFGFELGAGLPHVDAIERENRKQFHIVLPNGAGEHINHGINEPSVNDYALRYFNYNHSRYYDRAIVVSPGERGTIYCPPLNDVVKFKASPDKVAEGGKFTISWEAPFALSCVLSGKAPEDLLSSPESFDGARSYIKGSKTYDFVQRGIYTFQFGCQGYLDNKNSSKTGTITRPLTVYVGEGVKLTPKASLKVEPGVIKRGESATLSWTSENAASLYIDQGIGIIDKQGTRRVSPSVTTRYVITATGEFSELKYSATLRVLSPSMPGAATSNQGEEIIEIPPETSPSTPSEEKLQSVDLRINGQDGSLIMAAPATFNLSWNLDKYCLAYGSWIGIKTRAGQEQHTEIKPGNYTYKLYCPTVGSDEVKITVTGETGQNYVPLPIAEASASLDGKNFSRSIRVIRGEPTDIWLGAAYDVNGDKKVSRDDSGKWGSVISDGGRCDFNTDLNKGTPVFDGTVKNPQNPKDCTASLGKLTFYDKPGVYTYGVLRLVQNDGKVSKTSYINIVVQEPPLPKGPPEIDLKINGLESPVTLGAPAEYLVSWNVKNADSCAASDSWSGDRFPSGYQRFVSSEKKEFIYTLSCIGKLGTAKKSIVLKVTELPVCDFSALPITLSSSAFDRQSVLSWKCQFANFCEISPTVGEVDTFGTARVSPKNTTNYILTCRNLEGVSSFDQLVEVK